jgi:hypothetical protein
MAATSQPIPAPVGLPAPLSIDHRRLVAVRPQLSRRVDVQVDVVGCIEMLSSC